MTIQRRVALIGTGHGPWISTIGIKEPVAKITGLRPGGMILITLCRDPADATNDGRILNFTEDGKHPLHECNWMQVSCVDGGRKVICDILSKKVA